MMNESNVYAFFFCAHQGGGLHVRKQRPVEESGEPGDSQQVRTTRTQHGERWRWAALPSRLSFLRVSATRVCKPPAADRLHAALGELQEERWDSPSSVCLLCYYNNNQCAIIPSAGGCMGACAGGGGGSLSVCLSVRLSVAASACY